MVYNHTCEGSEKGPTMSWRGLDNASYYRLVKDEPRYAINDTGTGNTLNLSKARVIQMVADSLRYWATSYGIDGFRFDLGLTLGREDTGFDPGAAFFDVLRQDPVLGNLKLIVEPWDVGPGGYQLGNFAPGIAEWNDKYRDSVRRFWKGDEGLRPEFASRIAGSGDLFDRRARRPWASVNFLTAHDGQTLADVVSYEGKHNEANGEDNRDGSDDNNSCNWGVEGPDRRSRDPGHPRQGDAVDAGDVAHLARHADDPRRRRVRPHPAGQQQRLLPGQRAELVRLESSWKATEGHALSDFVRRLTAIRRHYPLVRANYFLHGEVEVAPGILDIDWFDERGQHLTPEDWHNTEGKALMMRRVRLLPDGRLEALAMLMNASPSPLTFTLPTPGLTRKLVIDSADPQAEEREIGDTIEVQDRAVVLVVGTEKKA